MDAIDIPVCLSQHFVNKQNVRSYGNIIKWNTLKKTTTEEFCRFLLKEEYLVRNLSSQFLQLMLLLKLNLMNNSKNDFKEYFNLKRSSLLQPVNKEYVFDTCWKLLCEIIPGNFFGCSQNKALLRKFVHTVIFSMKRQHHVIKNFVKKWNHSIQIWKNISNSERVLKLILFWIIKSLLAPVICLNFYVTTCKLDTNENKLYYFWKDQWQSFYDKQISKMIYTKVIRQSEPFSMGKKSRRKHSLANRLELKILKKSIPKLHLTLKVNNESRPIVCYKNNLVSSSEKYKIKDRLQFLRSLTGKPNIKIESLYNNLYLKWINADKPKLYFVKTDLSNAFGSINREKLAKILTEKYTTFLKAEMCSSKQKKIAQQYKDIVQELRKPILIRAGSTVYEWKEGLVQGYKYSPALSELYYSYLDGIYFSNHMEIKKNHIKLFTRVVDDYLYITDSLQDAKSFLSALTNYRNVNYDKTVVNFLHDTIKYSEEIVFLGYSYNTSTLQVSRANNIYAGQMCYKIAFTTGLSHLPRFIETRIGQSSIPINGHVFNLQYNNEELIWRHIFITFCLSANKFCTILAILCGDKEMEDLLLLYKKRVTVKLSNAIIETLMRNKPEGLIFIYCINHFRYLSWVALSLCAKITPKCSGLVPLINSKLVKTNCIFGKWREHASRISKTGECLRKASKDVCRRIDLRVTFRDFKTLPLEFECYHHRKL